MTENLLLQRWANLDSHELRLLLNARIGGSGQYDNYIQNPNKLYLPLARDDCRIALVFKEDKIRAIQSGPAFNSEEWQRISNEIDNSILTGPKKIGRGYSFSGKPVEGDWRGERSEVQILLPPQDTPSGHAQFPFIIEFPIVGAPADLWPITNHRRRRQHHTLTLLLNLLLNTRISHEDRRHEHVWAYVANENGGGESKWLQMV